MREPVTAYVALGGNLGDVRSAIQGAMDALGATRRSSLYVTRPVDAAGPDFINAVAAIETRLDAPSLLAELQRIENAAGRRRPYRNAPRTLDLDLLLYGSARIDSEHLQVPHPRMCERAFVLVPLAEIAPHLVSREQLAAVASQGIAALPAT